jgi:hypothetical protein
LAIHRAPSFRFEKLSTFSTFQHLLGLLYYGFAGDSYTPCYFTLTVFREYCS